MQKSLHLVWIILFFLQFAGCVPEREDPVPEPLVQAHYWDDVVFGGKRANLYVDREQPQVAYTTFWLEFPEGFPGDPASSHVDFHVRLDRLSSDYTEDYPEFTNLMPVGPASSPLAYDETYYLYTGTFVPFVAGDWTLDFNWVGQGQNLRAYIPVTIEESSERRAVIPVGSLDSLVVLAWLEPPYPKPGPQSYGLLAWRSSQHLQVFKEDRDLTITLYAPLPFVDPPEVAMDSSVATWANGRYTGTLVFPDTTGMQGSNWDISTKVARDSAMVGNGSFTLD